jgi:hypothetical protein
MAIMSIKQLLKKITPTFLQPAAASDRLRDRLKRSDRIFTGPFKGMRFVWEAWDANFANPMPKFLGTYELELHNAMETVCSIAPDLIVDVGAADGYYAVGLSLRVKSAEVVSFEELENGQKLVESVAELNGVEDRVRSLGRCEVNDLEAALSPGKTTFVMMDVEGYEDVLLDPVAIPALTRAHILVEAHDCYVPGMSEKIVERFNNTHQIEKITSRSRSISDIRPVSGFMKVYAKYNILGWTEERPFEMNWFFMKPNG